MLIVADGLIDSQEGLQLHPLLAPFRRKFAARDAVWFRALPQTPLSLVAWLEGVPPAALIASRINLPEEARQCWVASPFHARLMRDHLQVMPEGLLPWSAADAAALAELLNPLLEGEGMRLHRAGAALLLACREPLQVAPLPFGEVAGGALPNRHPDGADGGRLMRLLSEIQMFLHNHRSSLEGGVRDASGLWFWGGASLPLERPTDPLPVATHNAFLSSVTESAGARLTISDAGQLEELTNELPRDVILFGGGHAVWFASSITATIAAKLGKSSGALHPAGVQEEALLLQRLRAKL